MAALEYYSCIMRFQKGNYQWHHGYKWLNKHCLQYIKNSLGISIKGYDMLMVSSYASLFHVIT